ncbi:hypothetical protein ACQFZS_000040 [Klebsiella quasipneumoniae]
MPDSGLCVQGACVGQRLSPLAGEVDADGWLCLLEEAGYETGNTR